MDDLWRNVSDRIRRPIRFPPFFIDRARGLDVHVFSLSSRQGFPNLFLRDLKLGETFYSKSNFFNSEIFIEGKESIKACVSWKSKRKETSVKIWKERKLKITIRNLSVHPIRYEAEMLDLGGQRTLQSRKHTDPIHESIGGGEHSHFFIVSTPRSTYALRDRTRPFVFLPACKRSIEA